MSPAAATRGEGSTVVHAPGDDRSVFSKRHVLVVDDDPGTLDTTALALREGGFDVTEAASGAGALQAARLREYDLVVLDLMLPDVSGFDVLRTLRTRSSVPIIILTAKDAETDRVLGLEIGADDYVTKPFSLLELVSRVRAILRRRDLEHAQPPSPICQVGRLRVDVGRHEVHLGKKQIELTPFEFKLLALLAEKPGLAFTRREIMEHLWMGPYFGDGHPCDVHISNLRRKIERDAARPTRILTVTGVGYKLVAPRGEA